MGISCALRTKCGNRPSCQAHGLKHPASVLCQRAESLPFPFGVIEITSALLWIPWQHEPQNSNATGHGCVCPRSHLLVRVLVERAVIGWAVRKLVQGNWSHSNRPSLCLHSLKIRWKHLCILCVCVVSLMKLSRRVTAVSLSQRPHLHAPQKMWL